MATIESLTNFIFSGSFIPLCSLSPRGWGSSWRASHWGHTDLALAEKGWDGEKKKMQHIHLGCLKTCLAEEAARGSHLHTLSLSGEQAG